MPEEQSPPFLRLFLAIAVPPAVRQEIARAQNRLRRDAPPGVLRWIRPDQFHVTVKFLGDVPSVQLEDLLQSVSKVCREFPAMSLSARGIDFFPDQRRPRVIWVPAGDPGGHLAALHQKMDAALRVFAASDSRRCFAGHITLGRFKPGLRLVMDKVFGHIQKLDGRHFGDWRAGELEIVRSTLTAGGASQRILRLAGWLGEVSSSRRDCRAPFAFRFLVAWQVNACSHAP